MREIKKSIRLDKACYEIRGEIERRAQDLERMGEKVFKLNIGNPALFGFETPPKIIDRVKAGLDASQGYCESNGIVQAREAIANDCLRKGHSNVKKENIFLGNGVSELITLSLQGLLNDGDEVLVPSPDYPLWTASVYLAGGRPIHYLCDEKSDWNPSVSDMKKKITAKTRAVVVINPNNPTGAVYDKSVLNQIIELAREHDLIVFSDEIYDQVLYDDNVFVPMASLADDITFVSFNGLSKNYRACGIRCGWLVVSGDVNRAQDYIHGLLNLASMRLCSNVSSQFAVKEALENDSSIKELVKPGGRLREQRDLAYKLVTDIPGVSCVKPKGAMYFFPKIDNRKYSIGTDAEMALNLLLEKRVLIVQGSGFNYPSKQHFRLVFLPGIEYMTQAIARISEFLNERKTD